MRKKFTFVFLLLHAFFVAPYSYAKDILSADEVAADLQYFFSMLQSNFSYLSLSQLDLVEEQQKALLQFSDDNIPIHTLAQYTQRILGKTIDAHAETRKWETYLEKHLQENSRILYLPFLIESTLQEEGARYIAFEPDRSKFIAPNYPYLFAIEHISLTDWESTLHQYIPGATATHLSASVQRLLRYYWLAYYLHFQKALSKDKITITLENDLHEKKIVTLELAERPHWYGTWPKNKTQVLENNIGYLRLANYTDLSSKEVIDLHQNMKNFKNTQSLIIDFRKNGGGTRYLINDLLPYFMPDSEKYYIAALGKCRLFAGCEVGSRLMYPVHSKFFSIQEKQFIKKFQKQFSTPISYNKDLYSDWHYHLVRNSRNPQYFYSKPVYILMNKDNFSAADVFLSAFKGRPQITLIGEQSGGGSSAKKHYQLPYSELSVGFGRMLSLQKTGELFDGYGVLPDIKIIPEPTYFLGQTDQTLQTTIRIILDKAK
ncbi:MAG: hypothetical protein KDK51_06390 [Deltaproteobacteria bacterium]|nr:hypothetical protein [Deltaproteobacteria bacterium]